MQEVPFINGYTEFQEILSRSIDISRDSLTDKLEIELNERAVLPESLTYYSTNSESVLATLSVIKKEDLSYLVIEPLRPLANLSLSVSYSYRNEEPKKLYSIDYNKGVIYFSEPTTKEIKVTYQNDRLILTGRKGRQLEPTEYSRIQNRVNIFNFKENSTISFLYTNNENIKRNTSPVLQDLKLNYITMDERSL